jgi:hypothetical protein
MLGSLDIDDELERDSRCLLPQRVKHRFARARGHRDNGSMRVFGMLWCKGPRHIADVAVRSEDLCKQQAESSHF